MQGDFSTGGFPPEFDTVHLNSHQVLLQQGRILRDADFNEQSSLTLRYLRTVAADLIGQHGGPAANLAFVIAASGTNSDFDIGRSPDVPDPDAEIVAPLREYPDNPARYYVDGILCEQRHTFSYRNQPDYPEAEWSQEPGMYFAYLDVWYRYVSDAELNAERATASSAEEGMLKGEGLDFAEVALGLAGDTSGRAQVMAQVKLIKRANGAGWQDDENVRNKLVLPLHRRGRMKATVAVNTDNDPCLSRNGVGYSGPENQLYRVEIHQGGDANTATFKWSRENASVLFHAERATYNDDATTIAVFLSDLSFNSPFQLPRDSVVEIISPVQTRRGEVGALYIVKDILMESGEATLTKAADSPSANPLLDSFLLRRWDNPCLRAGDPPQATLAVRDAIALPMDLEYGLQAQFEGIRYFAGDYWLIPARPAISGILWPKSNADDAASALLLPPHGVEHHYVPLAILEIEASGTTMRKDTDLQCEFEGMAHPKS